MTGDGRLDLDDLGQVVDNATPLGADPHRDELVGGDDGPTWSERLAPARGYLRRHRITVVAVTAGALVLGVGAAGWNARQPPPPATELAVSLSFSLGSGIEMVEDSVVRLGVRALAQRPGETARVVGLVGTGLVASQATRTGPDTFAVSAVIDCGIEPGLATGTVATQHLVEVETTDTYGRTLRDAVAMVGVSDTLGYQLSQHCSQSVIDDGLPTRVTSARVDGDELALTVSVRNDTEHRVALSAWPESGTLRVDAPEIGLPPGRSRFWDVRLALTDCAEPRLQWSMPDGTWVDIGGTDLTSDPEDLGVDGLEPILEARTSFVVQDVMDDALSSMYQGPASRQIRLGPVWPELRSWVRSTCSGAVPVTATLRPDGRPRSRTTPVSPDEKTLPVTLAVRLPSGRVTVGPDVAVGNIWGSSLATRDAPEVLWEGFEGTGGQTVTVRLLWLFTCTGDLSPPRLAATVRADGRVSPWRIPLDGYRLADALRRACPIQVSSTQDLTDWGWDLSDRPILPLT